ncbi:MAG TPA: hypothetical protein VGG94_03695 [Chthoniobacterales bacterium]
MSFIRTGLREMGLKVRRQRTRMALRHERRLLQKSEINLGREGTSQAANFPELRQEIVALKKLEQEQKEVALRIAQIEESVGKIEADRQANAHEQQETTKKLETEKKPILHQRNDARSASEVCERELAAVDKRIEHVDAADRDLLKELTDLQGQEPPPPDREARSAALSARRARLPAEKAELMRARLGSEEASRSAREKLTAAETELAGIEKKIEEMRREFEARDHALNEQMRAQQDAIREARLHHQTVEERKNPAYLNIGRHLATQGIAPPNSPDLLVQVQRHREAMNRHQQHSAELALLSSQIDKQELRKFYFTVFSVLVLIPIIVFLVLQSPVQREWLPQETDAILAINVDRFERDDLPKKWRKDQPDVWANVWSGLLGGATAIPVMNIAKDAGRVTRAVATDNPSRPREFILIEAHSNVTPLIRAVAQNKNFDRRIFNGLTVWQRPDLAIARIGPATLAAGAAPEVDELIQVRLGMDPDLKISGQLFDRFQALDRESALRLISRNPADLPRVFHPIFSAELLDSAQMLGLALTLQNPLRARVLVKTRTAELATQLARQIHDEPQRWLRLQGSDQLLYTQSPEISRQDNNLEIRFNVPETSIRLLLQRIARTDAPAAGMVQPSPTP